MTIYNNWFKARLKQQQGLYEACRSDRNLYLKNLMESQDETNEMKKKLKIMTHQIDQFKEEIGNKESALVKVGFQTDAGKMALKWKRLANQNQFQTGK